MACVFVTGLEDGLVPIAHAHSTEALAEERRLLYVACTRAMDELFCSWARERVVSGGGCRPGRPRRFSPQSRRPTAISPGWPKRHPTARGLRSGKCAPCSRVGNGHAASCEGARPRLAPASIGPIGATPCSTRLALAPQYHHRYEGPAVAGAVETQLHGAARCGLFREATRRRANARRLAREEGG